MLLQETFLEVQNFQEGCDIEESFTPLRRVFPAELYAPSCTIQGFNRKVLQ